MADAPAAPKGGSSTFGFLGRKVGPLPVIAWAGLAFGVYWWYTHYGPGAATTTASTTTPAGPTVIEVKGRPGRRGKRGKRGPRGPEEKADVVDRVPGPRPARGAQPPMPLPVPAAAPGSANTAYDTGPPGAAEEGAYYAPPG